MQQSSRASCGRSPTSWSSGPVNYGHHPQPTSSSSATPPLSSGEQDGTASVHGPAQGRLGRHRIGTGACPSAFVSLPSCHSSDALMSFHQQPPFALPPGVSQRSSLSGVGSSMAAPLALQDSRDGPSIGGRMFPPAISSQSARTAAPPHLPLQQQHYFYSGHVPHHHEYLPDATSGVALYGGPGVPRQDDGAREDSLAPPPSEQRFPPLRTAPAPKRRSFFGCCRTFASELSHIKEAIIEGGNNLFGKWGGVVYCYPYTVICCSLLVAVVCAVGLIPGIPQWVDGAENLYSLPYSLARDHRKVHSEFFGDTATRRNALIVTHAQDAANVLTWPLLEELRRIDGVVKGRDLDPQGRMIRVPRTAADSHDDSADDRQTGRIASSSSVATATSAAAANAGTSSRNRDDDGGGSSGRGSTGFLDRSQYLTFEDICARNPWNDCAVDSVLHMGLDQWRALLRLPKDQTPVLPVFDGLVVNPSTKQFFVPEYYLGGTDIHDCVIELPSTVVEQLVSAEQVVGDGDMPGYQAVRVQCISRVEAFLITYDEDDKPAYMSRNERWEEVFIQVMEENQSSFGNLRISLQAFRSRDDELKSSTAESNDVVFVVLTFVILISYSSALNFSCDLFRSKAYAALAGAGAAMLGLVSGMGLVSLCQVAMVPTVLICPFLVMGIGVDDMFVIINSYSLSYMVQSAEDRCIVSLRDSGLSITITTTTNLIAFAVGAFSPYLSIKNFCIYSAAGLALGYVYVLTFFFAFLCLDAKREENAKVCFFCMPRKTPKAAEVEDDEEESEEHRGVLQQISTYSLVTYKVKVNADEKVLRSSMSMTSHQSSPRNISTLSCSAKSVDVVTGRSSQELGDDSRKKKPSGGSSLSNALAIYDPVLARQAVYDEPKGNVGRKWRLFFLNYYGPFLMRPWVKAVVIIVFSAFLGVSIFGFTRLMQGLNLTELAPENSYLRLFDFDVDRYFTKFDAPVDIFFPDKTNWWNPKVHESVRELHRRLSSRESSKKTLNPFLQLLDSDVYGARLRSGNKQIFERTLYDALSDSDSPFKQFEYDFIWEGRELYSWRFRLLPSYMRTSEERASWMQQIRADADAQKLADVPLTTVPYNFMMIFYESDLEIFSSVIINMTVAAVAMLLVAFVLIPQAVAGMLVILIMLLIDVGLFGFMYFWNVKLNMVSMINLVISIGFAVDYSAHMCHTFTHCEGDTRNFRVIESLVLMGNPVFHGAASTLLGVLMLGFSSSYVFKVFFKMMVMVIGFGSLHGVVLLPVLLSLIGQMDSPHHAHSSKVSSVGDDTEDEVQREIELAGGDEEDVKLPGQRTLEREEEGSSRETRSTDASDAAAEGGGGMLVSAAQGRRQGGWPGYRMTDFQSSQGEGVGGRLRATYQHQHTDPDRLWTRKPLGSGATASCSGNGAVVSSRPPALHQQQQPYYYYSQPYNPASSSQYSHPSLLPGSAAGVYSLQPPSSAARSAITTTPTQPLTFHHSPPTPFTTGNQELVLMPSAVTPLAAPRGGVPYPSSSSSFTLSTKQQPHRPYQQHAACVSHNDKQSCDV